MVRQEIYVNGELLELFDNISIPINYNIADIRDPSKRNASYSKTINIPATKANNLLFSNIFDINKIVLSNDDTINFNPDFNPTLKADCKVYIDGLLQLTGVMQMLQINVVDHKLIEYECIIIGEFLLQHRRK